MGLYLYFCIQWIGSCQILFTLLLLSSKTEKDRPFVGVLNTAMNTDKKNTNIRSWWQHLTEPSAILLNFNGYNYILLSFLCHSSV